MKLNDFLTDEEWERTSRASSSEWVEPMLAVLTDDHFSDPDWIYERKLDGMRLLARSHRGKVTLCTRNRKERNGHFPEIVEGLQPWADQCGFIVDGEVVAFDGNVTSFSRLQQRSGISDPDQARNSGVKVHFYVFDILNYDGRDVRALPLRRRKRLLGKAFDFSGPIRFTPHRNEHGEKYLEQACDKGWEGLIAKQASSEYLSTRSKKWLKFKCVNRQELVITGFTDPRGERKGFGALLVGYYDDGQLVDAGRVGTGYDDELLERLRKRLDSIERKTTPVDREPPGGEDIHWVSPKLVAEIGFTEWTRDKKLRHPRFIGLRDDKDPKDVVREVPQ